MREWLSWWSTTLPRSGSRVRVPSRALLIYKRYPKRIPFVYKRVLPDSNGSYLRSTSVGANGSPMDFQHPVSRNEGLRRTRTVLGLRSAPVGAEPTSTGCRAPSRASIRKRLETIYMQESCRTRTFEVFAPLRSALFYLCIECKNDVATAFCQFFTHHMHIFLQWYFFFVLI